jgi:hypothetical protein
MSAMDQDDDEFLYGDQSKIVTPPSSIPASQPSQAPSALPGLTVPVVTSPPSNQPAQPPPIESDIPPLQLTTQELEEGEEGEEEEEVEVSDEDVRESIPIHTSRHPI